MASEQEASRRVARLKVVFRDVLAGTRPVRNSSDAGLFLEAIQNHLPASFCIEKIISSNSGVGAVRDAVRVDLSLPFLVSRTLPFLRYLSDPGIKALVDGQLLNQMLVVIATPPTLWKTLLSHFLACQIPQEHLYPFAWLSFELVSLPTTAEVDILEDVRVIVKGGKIVEAEAHETRELGYRIRNVLQIRDSPRQDPRIQAGGPGGRHDNDDANFRNIQIYPTRDEFLSKLQPYYLTAKEVFDTDLPDRARVHLDNQFRLLREDMLAELREDIQVATGNKKGKRRAFVLGNLVPFGIDVGDEITRKFKKCSLAVQCFKGLELLQNMDVEKRENFLKSESSFLRHQAFGVLCRGGDIYGFAFIDRNADLLVKNPPVLSLQFTNHYELKAALLALQANVKTASQVEFILVDTPVFAYEPVLKRLQGIAELPLREVLLSPASPAPAHESSSPRLRDLIEQLKLAARNMVPGGIVEIKRAGVNPRFDKAQLDSLISGLTQQVSLIQGPPGTGKSFVGAEIARCIYNHSQRRILVLSYTNHAMDQFLEDLLKVGIPGEAMVRMGSKTKCTAATLPLVLSEQKSRIRLSRDSYAIIDSLKHDATETARDLYEAFNQYQRLSISWKDISEYLEFSSEDRRFYEALLTPTDHAGWKRVRGDGKKISPDYLYQRWRRGEDAGVFNAASESSAEIWNMSRSKREGHIDRWVKSMLGENIERILDLSRQFDGTQEKIGTYFQQSDVQTLQQKRVIGCTTTGAAKHAHLIRAAKPDVILVEEAGEIMESHILTAMSPTVEQLILIGDHKQLRPKVNNYALSVENGHGFDLNRSLFERMIMQGATHTVLRKQHRMIPELSIFPRKLTYPELLDGPKTSGRPDILGLEDRVVFLNHGKPENTDSAISDRQDSGGKASKNNAFEAEMAMRCLKYLGQQGYSSDHIVILTPYLGQLRTLSGLLRRYQHDPEISELDKSALLRAGLMTHAEAKVDMKPVRISTIGKFGSLKCLIVPGRADQSDDADNYQGEESDIIIASLTRSNSDGDIGFMAAPERLNVLITRARNCLILIGNMETFMASKKGKATWRPFFELLKETGHLYDGLPIKCERHPARTALLKEPIDFDKACPDGEHPFHQLHFVFSNQGLYSGATLQCGVHKCRLRCHRVADHSKTKCQQLISKTCARQHQTQVPCCRQQDGCHKCIQEDKEQELQIRRDLDLEAERQKRQAAYVKELSEIHAELDLQRRIIRYEAEEEEQKKTISQHTADLEALKETRNRIHVQKQHTKKSQEAPGQGNESGKPDNESTLPGTSKDDWEHMKKFEGAKSKPLDTLMDMIGLEDVKRAFLSIQTKVNTSLRQGVSLATERLSCSLLGNPGTGKTTVARLYAQFLTDVGAIPGSSFKETTGSALANIGVSGCKKLLDGILNDGGGVLFIDEGYQLSSGHNPGGTSVLDFLLAEVENNRGKVVFVLAGYARQMEGFFSHNPGLPSRFPIEMRFADYTDDELLRILNLGINRRYRGLMACEGGDRGLYCRIVARRIGRGRGRDGFGNARAVENGLAWICKRQANRLQRERRAGMKPDDFLFTKEDLIGPEPSEEALSKCPAWQKLQQLWGLNGVKAAVKALIDSIQENYQRELDEKPLIEYSLNKVFLGNPGTGKTTVAKAYGEILVSLGRRQAPSSWGLFGDTHVMIVNILLVVVKNPSDFVGGYLGQSEQQTKAILAATAGKVLVIDEAYSLSGGGGSQGSISDPYKTAVIDTLVAEVQSVPGDDRCVLLLGYKSQMETMFQNVNPGLSRRFPIASAFTFDDFTQEELGHILDLKLKQQGYRATGQAKAVAMDMLQRARNRPNFGNAGEVDIILGTAKERHQLRRSRGQSKANDQLEARDFDENFDRAEKAETNVAKLFTGTVGCEGIVELLVGYQSTVKTVKALGLDPKESVPFNFLFRGPPGTGKTTTAKKMGKVFYDMGFLATGEVVECSATDLIGQYTGQTGPKVQQIMKRALGRVLFVDEAYRLAEGAFAREAIDELVDCLTKETYYKKLVVILAGYEADINRLMAINPGLSSRFPEVIRFRALTPEECVFLLFQLLGAQKANLHNRGIALDLAILEEPGATFKSSTLASFSALAAQDSWANARDVKTLYGSVFNRVIKSRTGVNTGRLVLCEDMVTDELEAMFKERKCRGESNLFSALRDLQDAQDSAPADPMSLAGHKQETSVTVEIQAQPTIDVELEKHAHDYTGHDNEPNDNSRPAHAIQRDAGVSDAVWEQLQRDRQAEAGREMEYQRLVEAGQRAGGEARENILRRLLEEDAKRKREAEMRKQLQLSGLCPMGFQWIRQNRGFRCAGGSHFVSETQLANLSCG
ncbi:NFX1-type zinc finger-containing protein 1 [Tolypocladium capitatum]|uniref:NFX1-type zinc finger-containing protein 1 n=1 Tax=Tolypocladium capitatum TaxID=45235 RepID=A0A2K3QGT1_9HYPO|nr:NFX1-type zinc finger-containing protein 1 [Tolypocladium capitatum]